MNGFVLQNNKNIWYGSFAAFDALGFGNAFSCRLHGESALISGGLNLALHVGDEAGLVLKNRRAYAAALGLDAGKFTCCEQVHGSNVAVVDEALAVGDLEFQLKCMEKFTEIKNSGKTILFVSHDISSIRRFCDRSYWLKNGEVVEYGDTMEVTTNYENFLKKKSVKTVDRNKNQVERFAAPDIVDVTKAELLDKDKNPVDMLEQGEKLYVKVTYEVKDDTIKNPVLGIALRTVDNFYVCGLNTLLDGIKIPWKKGENIFYLEYEKLGLLAGEYYFDVAVFEENATVPLVYKTKYMNLFVSGSYIGEGIVVLDHKWEEGTHSNEI